MLTRESREKVKALYSDLLLLDDDSLDYSKALKAGLKDDENYKQLLDEKALLEIKIKEYEEKKFPDLISQINANKENKKLVKEDINNLLKPNKKKIVNDIYRYYKVKHNKGDDELSEVSNKYVEVFEIKD